MKRTILLFVIILPVLLLQAFRINDSHEKFVNGFEEVEIVPADTVQLFNGKNLDGFELILTDNDSRTTVPYKIENGELYFDGKQKGYFRTKETFSGFKLHAEWKWTEKNEKGNSGILVFTQPPDTVWPECIQIQLKKDNAGDLIAMNGAQLNETKNKPKDTAVKISDSNENPEGEWNSCDVICKEGALEVFINGKLQNTGTGSNYKNGTIGFQLEGKPIAFKNIFLVKL